MKLKIIINKTKNHHSGSPGPGGKMKLKELNHHSSSPGQYKKWLIIGLLMVFNKTIWYQKYKKMHTEIIHAWERWKCTEGWNLYKIYKRYPNKITKYTTKYILHIIHAWERWNCTEGQMYTPHTCICCTFTKYKIMIHTIFLKILNLNNCTMDQDTHIHEELLR